MEYLMLIVTTHTTEKLIKTLLHFAVVMWENMFAELLLLLSLLLSFDVLSLSIFFLGGGGVLSFPTFRWFLEMLLLLLLMMFPLSILVVIIVVIAMVVAVTISMMLMVVVVIVVAVIGGVMYLYLMTKYKQQNHI